MSENKPFEVICKGFEISLRDKIKEDFPFSIICENIDEFEPLLIEVMNCSARMNDLWEQTQRFEKRNQKLEKENTSLKKELFESRKSYLIETADISDKLYLEDEIEEERKEIFGDNND